MPNNEFNQPISVDFAPHNSVCEWCGKPAVQELTVIGGQYHNKGGFFCVACGKEFSSLIANTSKQNQSPSRSTVVEESTESHESERIPLD